MNVNGNKQIMRRIHSINIFYHFLVSLLLFTLLLLPIEHNTHAYAQSNTDGKGTFFFLFRCFVELYYHMSTVIATFLCRRMEEYSFAAEQNRTELSERKFTIEKSKQNY